MLRETSSLSTPGGADAIGARSRWQQVAAELRQDIASGRFAPDEKLPNEQTLAQRFGVNRHTLRQAMQRLAAEGFVRVAHGSGTYVRALVLDYALKRRTRLSENLSDAGERAARELLGHGSELAGPWAADLRVKPRSRVEVMRTRAVVRGRPIGISTAAYPLPRLAGMAEAFRATGSVTRALQQLGVADFLRERSSVSCRLPSVEEADALARPPTEPVLVVQFVNVDALGIPVEAGTTLFAADAVQLTVATPE